MNGVLREEGLCLIVFDGRVNDDISTLLPVDWGGDAVLVTNLESYISGGEYETRVRRLAYTYNQRP